MSRGPFYSKFKLNTRELISDYPELYKQIYSYYKGRDIYLYDDKDKDYNIILDELEYDLLNAGVMV